MKILDGLAARPPISLIVRVLSNISPLPDVARLHAQFRAFTKVADAVSNPSVAATTAPREERARVVVVIEKHLRRVHWLVAVLAMISARRAVTLRWWRQVATFPRLLDSLSVAPLRRNILFMVECSRRFGMSSAPSPHLF